MSDRPEPGRWEPFLGQQMSWRGHELQPRQISSTTRRVRYLECAGRIALSRTRTSRTGVWLRAVARLLARRARGMSAEDAWRSRVARADLHDGDFMNINASAPWGNRSLITTTTFDDPHAASRNPHPIDQRTTPSGPGRSGSWIRTSRSRACSRTYAGTAALENWSHRHHLGLLGSPRRKSASILCSRPYPGHQRVSFTVCGTNANESAAEIPAREPPRRWTRLRRPAQFRGLAT